MLRRHLFDIRDCIRGVCWKPPAPRAESCTQCAAGAAAGLGCWGGKRGTAGRTGITGCWIGKTCMALQDLGTSKNAHFEADFVSEIDLQTSVTRPVAGYVSIPRRREGSQLSQRNFSSDFPSLAGRWLAWTPWEVPQHTVGRGDSHC